MEDQRTYETTFVRRRFVARSKVDGQHRTALPEYRIWTGMIARCSNPKTQAYKHYGARGISVCDRWREDFQNFYRDMGPRPSPKHSVDRYPDNDGNYEPGNCRWATPREQVLNRRAGGNLHGVWTAGDYATLKRMFGEHYSVEEIAVALNRSVATIRLRLHKEGLKRDGRVTRLAKEHPDLRPILVADGKDAFLREVAVKLQGRRATAAAEMEATKRRIANAAAEIAQLAVARNEKMRLMRQRGLSLASIGRHFGITRERVRQLEAAGFPTEVTCIGGSRKISATRPEKRRKHVDRLCRAWNAASREARLAFLQASPHFMYGKLSAELVEAGVFPATQPAGEAA